MIQTVVFWHTRYLATPALHCQSCMHQKSRRGSPSPWSCRSAMRRPTWPPTSTSTISRRAPSPSATSRCRTLTSIRPRCSSRTRATWAGPSPRARPGRSAAGWTRPRRCAWTASTRPPRPRSGTGCGSRASRPPKRRSRAGARQYAKSAAYRGLGRGEQWLDSFAFPARRRGWPRRPTRRPWTRRSSAGPARWSRCWSAPGRERRCRARGRRRRGRAGGHGLGHRGRAHGREPPDRLPGRRGRRHGQRPEPVSSAVDIQTLNGTQESGVQQHFAMHQQRQRPTRSSASTRTATPHPPAPRVRARAARQQPSG